MVFLKPLFSKLMNCHGLSITTTSLLFKIYHRVVCVVIIILNYHCLLFICTFFTLPHCWLFPDKKITWHICYIPSCQLCSFYTYVLCDMKNYVSLIHDANLYLCIYLIYNFFFNRSHFIWIFTRFYIQNILLGMTDFIEQFWILYYIRHIKYITRHTFYIKIFVNICILTV